jgi:hypothetical protein
MLLRLFSTVDVVAQCSCYCCCSMLTPAAAMGEYSMPKSSMKIEEAKVCSFKDIILFLYFI